MNLSILQIEFKPTSYLDITQQILDWAKCEDSRYICVANVHMLMEAQDSLEYQHIINSADFVTPDGMPLVWMMRLKGQKNQERVYGPTLMLHILDAATREKIPVGFYGGKPEVLQTLIEKIKEQFKSLDIVYAFSPS